MLKENMENWRAQVVETLVSIEEAAKHHEETIQFYITGMAKLWEEKDLSVLEHYSGTLNHHVKALMAKKELIIQHQRLIKTIDEQLY